MAITVCVAGATGWTGSAVARAVLADPDFRLVGAVARSAAGRDVGDVLGVGPTGIRIASTLVEALQTPVDVLVDYTAPGAVFAHTLAAIERGVRVVVGTSGLGAAEFAAIDAKARAAGCGVVAAGNFSLTAALAKRFALMAAEFIPDWEVIDYADAAKADAPSGSARELAEALSDLRPDTAAPAPDRDTEAPGARGAVIDRTRVHSVRLPGYVLSFEAAFGKPDERLLIRHDAGAGAGPYVAGTLLAAKRVLSVSGVVRGLDTLLFGAQL